tara:strand:- start:53 stop:424 length:372 start_codon:yes stop_codon:yes gene_type:complete
MPRPKRKNVALDKDSVEQLLQESYNEACENRSKAITMLNKQLRDVNDNTDIQQIGKINNELLRIIDSSISKKLDIVKLQITLVKTGNESDDSSFSISDEDKQLIEGMIKQSEEPKDNNIEYDV